MSRASDFFYKFQGIPLSVGTELGVSLGGPQACMPHQLADGVQRDILTGQPRAKGMSQGVNNDFEPGSVIPSFRPRMFTAFVMVWVKALGRI